MKVHYIYLLLFCVQAKSQPTNKSVQSSTSGYVGLYCDYNISSHKKNSSASNILFQGNSYSIGFTAARLFGLYSSRASKTKETEIQIKSSTKAGIVFNAGIQFGKIKQADLKSFAKGLTSPLGYNITQKNSDYTQLVLLTGPCLNFFSKSGPTRGGDWDDNGVNYALTKGHLKNYLLQISVSAGIAFNLKPNTIVIDKMDNQVVVAKVFDKTEQKIVFAWQGYITIPIAKLGNHFMLCIGTGYGFNGGNIGVTFRKRHAAALQTL